MRTSAILFACLFVAAAMVGCGGPKGSDPEQEKAAISVAASPVQVADKPAEFFEVVSSKVAGQDESNFQVSAGLKATKAVESPTIYVIADVVATHGDKKSSVGSAHAQIQGPLEEGKTVEVTFVVSRLGDPGERTLVIKWMRDKPPGE